jgi:hypothetical protein
VGGVDGENVDTDKDPSAPRGGASLFGLPHVALLRFALGFVKIILHIVQLRILVNIFQRIDPPLNLSIHYKMPLFSDVEMVGTVVVIVSDVTHVVYLFMIGPASIVHF